ncbi:4Fe-4S binding protein [Candidatus Pacearchaeota archaeon]|nr:4Fe-4S binding protein [Candidatus Pacearchaeota archaeon]
MKNKKEFAAIITEAGNSIKNKTGSWRTMKPIVLKNKCTACGICAKFCPDGAIIIKNKKMSVDYEHCKGCAICSVECPSHSIIMKEEKK